MARRRGWKERQRLRFLSVSLVNGAVVELVFFKTITVDSFPFGRPVEEDVQSIEKCWP